MCERHRDAALDSLALVRARLDGDDDAAKFLLDQGCNRDQASMLASLMAVLLMGMDADPAVVLHRFAAMLGT